jgi:hypothetical protein
MSSTGSKSAQGRRDFLTHAAAGGVCLLTFPFAGCDKRLTPAQARAAELPLGTLEPGEVNALEALGETLLPGSAAAGLAHYIDHQLSAAPADSMLMIKYLRVPAPFTDFYRSGLRAADAAANALHGKGLRELNAQQSTDLVTRMSAGRLTGWQPSPETSARSAAAVPAAALFYFVLRSDAIDVMYGTKSGFARLGVPYMAHIEPPSRWGE